MHAAAESRTDQDPQCAREKTKLCRQHGPNQRSRPGDRRKMMSKHHPPIRRDVIFVVISQNCRCGTLLVKDEHFCCEPFTVETVADR